MSTARSRTCIFERPDSARRMASLGEANGVADMWTPLHELMSTEAPERGEDGEVPVDVMMLAQALRAMPEHVAAQALQEHMVESKAEVRRKAFNAFLRYCWHECVDPWAAMKRLLATTRAVKADLIRGISGTECAALLGETRAAEQARRQKVVEELLRRWDVRGYLGTGGTKSTEARRKLSESHMGNNSRAKGERKKRAKKFLERNGINKTES